MYTYELTYAGWMDGSGWSYESTYETGEAESPMELWTEDDFKAWVKENADSYLAEDEDIEWTYTTYKNGKKLYELSVWEKEA